MQHCQATQARCLSMRPLDTLQSCPTLSLNPAHALFSRVVLEFGLGLWQGGLSRLGPFCVVELGPGMLWAHLLP